MRWPIRRKDALSGAVGAVGVPEVSRVEESKGRESGVVEAAPPRPVAVARPMSEWRKLPAIQRAIPPAPEVLPKHAFEALLPTCRVTGYLQPLGHQLSADGPGGIVRGLARAVPLGTPVSRYVETPMPLVPPTRPVADAEIDPSWVAAESDDAPRGPMPAPPRAAPPAPLVVARRVDVSPLLRAPDPQMARARLPIVAPPVPASPAPRAAPSEAATSAPQPQTEATSPLAAVPGITAAPATTAVPGAVPAAAAPVELPLAPSSPATRPAAGGTGPPIAPARDDGPVVSRSVSPPTSPEPVPSAAAGETRVPHPRPRRHRWWRRDSLAGPLDPARGFAVDPCVRLWPDRGTPPAARRPGRRSLDAGEPRPGRDPSAPA